MRFFSLVEVVERETDLDLLTVLVLSVEDEDVDVVRRDCNVEDDLGLDFFSGGATNFVESARRMASPSMVADLPSGDVGALWDPTGMVADRVNFGLPLALSVVAD